MSNLDLLIENILNCSVKSIDIAELYRLTDVEAVQYRISYDSNTFLRRIFRCEHIDKKPLTPEQIQLMIKNKKEIEHWDDLLFLTDNEFSSDTIRQLYGICAWDDIIDQTRLTEVLMREFIDIIPWEFVRGATHRFEHISEEFKIELQLKGLL